MDFLSQKIRKRQPTSGDESDSSDDDDRHQSTRYHSSERRSLNSSSDSPHKKVRVGRQRNSGNDSSFDSLRNRDSRLNSSDSDGSPAKRSVASKVEKSNVSNDMRDSYRDGTFSRRDQYDAASRSQRSRRKDETSDRHQKSSEKIYEKGHGKESRMGQRSDNRHQDRFVGRDRNDFRNDGNKHTSERGPGRSSSGMQEARYGSPIRDQWSHSDSGRLSWIKKERFDDDEIRGQNSKNDPRKGRLSERRIEDDENLYRSRDRSNGKRRSKSPVDRRNRNDSDVSYEKSALSPEPMTSGRGSMHQRKYQRGRRQSSVTPDRTLSDIRRQRSMSPRQSRSIKEERMSQSISPVKSKHANADELDVRHRERNIPSDLDSDDVIEPMSDLSKKSKGKKKKKAVERDNLADKSFERSKKLLENSADFENIEADEIHDALSQLKKRKRSKRQNEMSDSEEIVQKKSKRSKDTGGKKSKKKTKRSLSGSPSPVRRSLGRNSSRSLERSFGRNHDMTKFESEPESGEITDSEVESEQGRQPIKSLINKPKTDDGVINNEDDLSSSPSKKMKVKDRSKVDKRESGKKQEKDRGSKRKAAEVVEPTAQPEPTPATKKPKADIETLTGRTGGAYIPPARLRAMQASITDKSSVEYQRLSWEALKKSINGLVNKVNVTNIENIVREIFQENIVRGRGLMARSIIQAQAASPTFTHVYAALVAIVNTKFPQNGELILRRLILQFRRGYKRNDKSICLSATRFIAHLVNQQVAHEVLALETLTLLLDTPTDDSVEVSVGFLKECGQKLTEVSPRGINAIFERLRNILHEGQIDIRVQYMVEVMFAVRKDRFKDFPAVVEDLDLVEEEDQFTHLLSLEDAVNGEEILNVFKADPNFEENEEKYKILKKEILGEGSSDEEGESGSDSDSESDSEEEQDAEAEQKIIDQTETNMVALRRTIYLTIQSSLDFEECAHKLMKMELRPGQEVELCNMILDCCAQMRTYEKFFGLLAGRFCMLDKKYVEPFQVMFKEQYDTIHRLETNKLRNVAKFFAHLLHTDSISWAVLQAIRLNEDDTTSASRIFIKILFQELSEYLGLPKLNERLKDPTLQEYYSGLLPRDNPRDTRFAINFFTTIGLGGLTDDLRDHLKDVSKKLMQQKQEAQVAKETDSSDDSSDHSSSDESSDSENSDSSSSISDSDSSEEERKKKKKNKKSSQKFDDRKAKEKLRIEKGKKSRKDKENSYGSFDRRIGDNVEKVGKKDKKKAKQNEDDKRREQEAQFKKLAKLANYGDIDNLPTNYSEDDGRMLDDRRSSKKERKDKKGKEDRGRNKNKDNDFGGYDERVSRKTYRQDKSFDDLDEFDARKYADRSFDSGHNSRDDSFRDEDRNSGGNRHRRDDRGVGRESSRVGREERGRFDERNVGKQDMSQRGRNRKGREVVEDDIDDKDIRVERNFERMDLYEQKFEREREKNIEKLRDREEFQDYYRGRARDEGSRRGPGPQREDKRGREMPYKGGRDRDAGDSYDYVDMDDRRGKSRAELRDDGERRRRR